MNIDWPQLLAEAEAVSKNAYAPYSKFRVGAALLDPHGKIHAGTNVENLSFGLTLCAERSAVVRAVADGQQTFAALALYTEGDVPVSPCGACRQVLAEFEPSLPIVCLAGATGEQWQTSLSELLPRPHAGILDGDVPRGT